MLSLTSHQYRLLCGGMCVHRVWSGVIRCCHLPLITIACCVVVCVCIVCGAQVRARDQGRTNTRPAHTGPRTLPVRLPACLPVCIPVCLSVCLCICSSPHTLIRPTIAGTSRPRFRIPERAKLLLMEECACAPAPAPSAPPPPSTRGWVA